MVCPRDVPLLVEMCQSAVGLELQAGAFLFQEGEPIGKFVHVLQDGELEISVSSEGAGVDPPLHTSHPSLSMTDSLPHGSCWWVAVGMFAPGSMPSGEAGHRDVLAVVKEPGSIVTGLMDLLAHLTAFPVGSTTSSSSMRQEGGGPSAVGGVCRGWQALTSLCLVCVRYRTPSTA